MTISGDDFNDRRNGAWRNRAGRNSTRRAEAVRSRADALYMIEEHRRVNDEVRQSGEYAASLQRAERETPLEAAPYRDHDLIAQGYALADEYAYRALNGAVLYFSRRYEHPGIPGGKQFRQGRHDASSPTGEAADAGPVKVPYHWTELAAAEPSRPVYYCEGEKDVETCERLGLIATTAAGQQLSVVLAKALTGRHVVVLVDKDSSGEKNAAKAVQSFRPYAASVRVVRLPRLQRNEDVTDWLNQRGGTLEELNQIVNSTASAGIDATPFVLQSHAEIARREWLYKPAYVRGNVSVTAGAGARGKSSLIVAEALAMASGKSFLGVQPPNPLRIWYVNLEDDADELKRRFNAAATFHELTPASIGDRLFVDSGRLREIIVAAEDERRRAVLNEAVLDEVRATIRRRNIDVVILDPFVSLHRVSENDNGAIDLVAKALARIAQDERCSMMLVHHTRKPNGDVGGVDDTRGASALANAARYVRVLNPMTAEEAQRANVDPEKRGFYFRAIDGKSNLTPPAERSDWFRLESVQLGNGGDFEAEGDSVGVVVRFAFAAPASAFAQISEVQIRQAFGVGGPWRFDRQARSQWAGDQLALSLGVGAETKAEKDALQRALRNAVQRGWLTVDRRPDAHRNAREWVKVVDAAAPSQGDAAQMGDAT